MTWLTSLLATFLTAAGDFLRGFFRDRKAVSDAEGAGAAKAETEGLRKVNEIADQQVRRAADDLSPDDVLDRLDRGAG